MSTKELTVFCAPSVTVPAIPGSPPDGGPLGVGGVGVAAAALAANPLRLPTAPELQVWQNPIHHKFPKGDDVLQNYYIKSVPNCV